MSRLPFFFSGLRPSCLSSRARARGLLARGLALAAVSALCGLAPVASALAAGTSAPAVDPGHRPAAAGSPAAHHHGVGQLDIGLDGDRLQVTLTLPLDSLLGHERAPRTTAEREAARRAVQRLRATADWLRPDAAAACRLVDLAIEAPVLRAVLEGGTVPPAQAAPAPARATARPGPAAASSVLAPAVQDEGHADLDLDATWQCAAPGQLRTIEQRLFAQHPRLQTLEVRIAGPRGQRQRTLSRPQARIDGL
ncbi:ZrgA family zinc uptake protein [Pseudaquabacterium rugosum]|uniref:DUF2796 domain-containing protein n=1 Tax=Pseudaquabacterium rugosum TaxID=2984194 RepID=A0ABU9B9V3_9BURK